MVVLDTMMLELTGLANDKYVTKEYVQARIAEAMNAVGGGAPALPPAAGVAFGDHSTDNTEYIAKGKEFNDIVDAINAKTGGSASMTPAQMVTEIGSIQAGGLVYETGTITMTGSRFSVTHGLNTDKVILIISPISGEEYIATAGYQPFTMFVGNFKSIAPFSNVTLNYSAYHSSVNSQQIANNDNKYRIGVANPSPWSSQPSWETPSGDPVVFRNNFVSFTTSSVSMTAGNTYAAMKGTYKYCVISCEGVSL